MYIEFRRMKIQSLGSGVKRIIGEIWCFNLSLGYLTTARQIGPVIIMPGKPLQAGFATGNTATCGG